MHRLAHVEEFSPLLLGHYTGFLDEIDIGLCAAVSDWWLVCIHLDDGVVHAHCRERGQNMLHCVHSHRPLTDSRGALDRFEILDLRIDGPLILQIFTLEFDAMIYRRRMQFQSDFVTRMQRRTAKAGG